MGTDRDGKPNPDGPGPGSDGGLLPEFVRRAVERSVDVLLNADDDTRKMVAALVPRELLQSITQQVDVAKRDAVAMVGREMQTFLQNLNVGDELRKVLTSVSFEITTQVRFVPNEDGTLRSEVKTAARPAVVRGGKKGRARGNVAAKTTGKKGPARAGPAPVAQAPAVPGALEGVAVVDGEFEDLPPDAPRARSRVRAAAGGAARTMVGLVDRVAGVAEKAAVAAAGLGGEE